MKEMPASLRRFCADRLVALRRAAGLTQGDLARVAQVVERSYAMWEAAERFPHAYSLLLIAAHYGVTMESFFP